MVMSSSRLLGLLILLPFLIAVACILSPLLLGGNRGSAPESSSAGNQVLPSLALGDEAAEVDNGSDTNAQLLATPTPYESQLAVSSPDMQQLAPLSHEERAASSSDEPQLSSPVQGDAGGSKSMHDDQEGDEVTSVDWDALFAAALYKSTNVTEHIASPTPSKSGQSSAPSLKPNKSKSNEANLQTSISLGSEAKSGKASKGSKSASDNVSVAMWDDLVAIANTYVESQEEKAPESNLFQTPTQSGESSKKE